MELFCVFSRPIFRTLGRVLVRNHPIPGADLSEAPANRLAAPQPNRVLWMGYPLSFFVFYTSFF